MIKSQVFYISLVILALAPAFFAGASSLGLIEAASPGQIFTVGAITLPLSVTLLIAGRIRSHNPVESVSSTGEDIKWIRMVYDNTDELILVLNQYAQILSFNRSLTRTLYYNRPDIMGIPFRDLIYNEYINDRRMNEKILTKLRDVFSGNETSIICPCRRKDDTEPVNVTFRMIPVMKDSELENILVIGSVMQPDSLTKNYLLSETSSYMVDNNLSHIFLLCHRLTRNLDDRLPKNAVTLAQIALQEVFMNSIEHGNLEIDYEQKTSIKMKKGNYWEILISQCDQNHLRDRKIYVSYCLDRESVVYTIRDEGKGFQWKDYLDADRESIEKGLMSNFHGVGLQIVKSAFEVKFNEKGNEVTLTRRFGGQG